MTRPRDWRTWAKVWAFFVVPVAIIVAAIWGEIAGPPWVGALLRLLGF